MGYDYDALYGQEPDALGPPTPAFVDFFDRFGTPRARVLDVGCGQGRDAIFIARRGHQVVGVDLSPNGIRDLRRAAEAENLPITGEVADIVTYQPDGTFDVILIDRTLHMLSPPSRLAVLARLLDHVADDGWLLIADERCNIPAFEDLLIQQPSAWQHSLKRGGYLFTQRVTDQK